MDLVCRETENHPPFFYDSSEPTADPETPKVSGVKFHISKVANRAREVSGAAPKALQSLPTEPRERVNDSITFWKTTFQFQLLSWSVTFSRCDKCRRTFPLSLTHPILTGRLSQFLEKARQRLH